MTIALALANFALTLTLVLSRPRGLNPAWAASIGAVLGLAIGVIRLHDVPVVAGIVWNATLALIAIMIISRLLDEAGFFCWIAYHLARRANGSGRGIFLAVCGFAAVVSTVFTNDATVLILTPIVYETLAALGMDGRRSLPFLVACGFIADTVSTPLTVSNLTNIIVADYFHLPFAPYAAAMALPSLFSLLASAGVLYAFYRRAIPRRYDVARVPEPATAIRDPLTVRVGAAVAIAMGLAFVFGPALGVPVSAVLLAGAAVLLLSAAAGKRLRPAEAVRRAPWHVLLFSLAMYLVVYGLRNAGVADVLGQALRAAAAGSPARAVFATGVTSAAISAVINNLPAVVLGALAIAPAPGPVAMADPVARGMVLAHVIGVDVGPKLTPIGSLATLIWLHDLELRGVHMGWAEYLRVGLLLTPPVLLAALGGLWLALRLGL